MLPTMRMRSTPESKAIQNLVLHVAPSLMQLTCTPSCRMRQAFPVRSFPPSVSACLPPHACTLIHGGESDSLTGLPSYGFDFVARVRVGLADNETHPLSECPMFVEHKVLLPPAPCTLRVCVYPVLMT